MSSADANSKKKKITIYFGTFKIYTGAVYKLRKSKKGVMWFLSSDTMDRYDSKVTSESHQIGHNV